MKVLKDEEDTMNGKKVSQKIKELYYNLTEKVSSWDDFRINCKKNYIGFKKGNKSFVFLNFIQRIY